MPWWITSRRCNNMLQNSEDKDHLRATQGESPISLPDDEALHKLMDFTWQRSPGFLGWIASTNHKDIALRWIVTAFIFFLLAGVLALLMRFQLAFPNNH